MSRSRRLLVLWTWAFALSALAYAPAIYEWDKAGWGDWQWFHHLWEVGRVSIFRYHEFPLWDPHHCGGVSAWGQPQSQHLAPTYWITGLLFGTTHGHKLFLLLHHAVGFAGMFVVGRRLYGFKAPAAALSALVWTFSGFFAWRTSGGHSTFLAFHYLPFVFYCWRRTNTDLRYAGGVAVLMGMMLVEGGTYPFPLTFLLLLFDFVVQMLPPRVEWRVIRTGLITGVLTALIGAVRFWPIFATMRRFPRETEMEDAQTLEHILESLTARDPHPWQWGHRWVWPEYSAFIGWAVLALAAYGTLVALGRHRKRWYWVAGAALFCACAMGNVDAHWPWPFLHDLPVFKNFHVPSRFHVLLTFYLTLLAGLALDRGLTATIASTTHRGLTRALVALAWLLVVGCGAEVMTNTIRIAARWHNPDVFGAEEEHFHLVAPVNYDMSFMHYPQRNVGSTGCYDPVPWDISRALWTGDRPQIRVDPPAAGTVEEDRRTNHTLHGEVTLREPARVIFNQNFDPDWHTSVGAPVNEQGLMAVDLGVGSHTIDAWFAPPDLPWSVLVTLFGLLLSAALALFGSPVRWSRRRKRRLAGVRPPE